MKLTLSKEAERRLRTCGECGYITTTRAEYHPHAFCVLVKAGYDPWQVVRTAHGKDPGASA